MEDKEYEQLLRIYDPTSKFEVRTILMQMRNKHNPSVFRNKKLNTQHFHSLFATLYYCVRMSTTHSIYVHMEGRHGYPVVCVSNISHVPAHVDCMTHTKSSHKLNN